MSQNRNLPMMLFILGLFLIVIGIVFALYTTTETYYQSYFGVNIPQQRTVQPYVMLGAILAFFGILVLLMAFFENQSKKGDTIITTMEIPKT
jgi:uncharacterized membrane protein YidH (DUF202 family)